jgi:lysozyme family protein
MAQFNSAFETMILNEGGMTLHRITGDRGGLTYAGIARVFHPHWPGWALIDAGDVENPGLTQLVREFYKDKFWVRIKGEAIAAQPVAEQLFDFAVNAGVGTAIKLAQVTVGVVPDGVVGPITLEALNNMDAEAFVLKYALAKMSRYAAICNRDRSQCKFLLGWVNRTLKEVA